MSFSPQSLLLQRWESTAYLVQHLYNRQVWLLPTIPYTCAENGTAPYFGDTSEYSSRMKEWIRIHMG